MKIAPIAELLGSRPLYRSLNISAVFAMFMSVSSAWAQPPAGVIVEFERINDSARTDMDNSYHKQFRKDLEQLFPSRAALDGDDSSRMASPLIATQFDDCLQGAAVDIQWEQAQQLRSLPYVKNVYPNEILKSTTNDAAQITGARLALTTPFNVDGTGVKVGIIDSGVDYRHPDLGGGVGVGFPVVVARDLTDPNGDGLDVDSHGTPIAGIIGARGAGAQGIAPGASLYSYKTSINLSHETSRILEAMELAYQDGVHILNMSLAGLAIADSPINVCSEWLFDHGVLVVASSGNSGAHFDIPSPAMSPKVLAVGASTKAGGLASFSTRGPANQSIHIKPDLIAPGENLSAQAIGGSGSTTVSGTSFSAPVVSGLAALYKQYRPQATPAEIMGALMQGGVKISMDPSVTRSESLFSQGFGVANIVNSLQSQTWVYPSTFSLGLVTADDSPGHVKTLTLGNHRSTPATCAVSATLPTGVTIKNQPSSVVLPSAVNGQASTTQLDLEFEVIHANMQAGVNLLNPDLIDVTLACQASGGDGTDLEQLAVVGTVMRQLVTSFNFGPTASLAIVLEVDATTQRVSLSRFFDGFQLSSSNGVIEHFPSSQSAEYIAIIEHNGLPPLITITEPLQLQDGGTINLDPSNTQLLQPQVRLRDGRVQDIPMILFPTFAFETSSSGGAMYEGLPIKGEGGLRVAIANGAKLDIGGAYVDWANDTSPKSLDVYSYTARIDHQTQSLPLVSARSDYLTRQYPITLESNESVRVARIGIVTPSYTEQYTNGTAFICPENEVSFAIADEAVMTVHSQPVTAGNQPAIMNYFAVVTAQTDDLNCGVRASFDQDLFEPTDLKLVTAGLYADDSGKEVQYPHISPIYQDYRFSNRIPPLDNPTVSGLISTNNAIPHPKLLFTNISPGVGVAGYFFTPWDDLMPGTVRFSRWNSDETLRNTFELPNYQRNLPFSDQEAFDSLINNLDLLSPGESITAEFSGYEIDGQSGEAHYRYEFSSSKIWNLNAIALNRLMIRPTGGLEIANETRFNVNPGAEIFFQVLGTGEGPAGTFADSVLPAISDASQMAVSIAPAGLTAPTVGDWIVLSNLQVTGLGTFASGRGPEVIAPLPQSLAVGAYQLLIEVEDDGGNKMTYRVNPAFSIELEDTIFLDRFQ